MSKDIVYLTELDHVEFQPVFILGVHRSGTSILYQILAQTGCFNTVSAYHIIKYESLLFNFINHKEEEEKQILTLLFNKRGVKDRGIDRLKISVDFAEEYGFLLGEKTNKMCISNHNVDIFIQLCKKVQYINGNNKQILLKNPYDFSNFLYLKQVFPTAKFVFIHRHPLKSINSMLSAIQNIIQKKNAYTAKLSPLYDKFYDSFLLLYPLRFMFSIVSEIGVILISKMTSKATKYYLKNIDKLSSSDYVSITYEQLCLHAQDCLDSIMKKFSLTLKNNFNANDLITPRQLPINSSVLKLRRYILKSMKKYCKKFSYF